jgi:hypothetical protein
MASDLVLSPCPHPSKIISAVFFPFIVRQI